MQHVKGCTLYGTLVNALAKFISPALLLLLLSGQDS